MDASDYGEYSLTWRFAHGNQPYRSLPLGGIFIDSGYELIVTT